MSIKKIAEMTGTSLATVSRVLNDPNHKCKDEAVRQKIFDIARQLNYIPNEYARGLRQKQVQSYSINYIKEPLNNQHVYGQSSGGLCKQSSKISQNSPESIPL